MFPFVEMFPVLVAFENLDLLENLQIAKKALYGLSGIYGFVHIPTGTSYIGSSISLFSYITNIHSFVSFRYKRFYSRGKTNYKIECSSFPLAMF